MRVISLNLNGIRSAATKGVFPWLARQEADIVCLQELKAQIPDIGAEMLAPANLTGAFHSAEKKVTAASAFIFAAARCKFAKD